MKELIPIFAFNDSESNEYFNEQLIKAQKKFEDAKNYPRKTKKRMRKEALLDIAFYNELILLDSALCF